MPHRWTRAQSEVSWSNHSLEDCDAKRTNPFGPRLLLILDGLWDDTILKLSAVLSHSAPCITQALFLYHCSSLPIPGCVSVGPEGLQCCSCPCWRSLGSWVAAQPLFAGLSRSFAEPQDGLWGLRAEIEMKAWRISSSQCLLIVLKSRQLTIIIIVPQKQWELNWKALLFFRCLISTEAENELYFSGDLRMHPRSLQSQQAKFFHIQPSTLTGNAASSCLLFSSPISVGCECAHFSSHSIYS